MTTQVDRVRAHLLAGKTITPASAIAVYGIFRLSSVIEDLRQSGMEIDCVLKYDEMGKQYGEYRERVAIGVNSTVQVKRGFGVGLPYWVRSMKRSRVVAKKADASLVRFIRGKNMADLWVNDKELVNAD
jgi:Helix-turn-helix domain